jgi:hypothetical protein
MAFETTNSNNNIILSQAGELAIDFANWVITAKGYSETATPLAGYFCRIDTSENLELGGGADTVGVAVLSRMNAGINCTENPIQTYTPLGVVYVALKDGIDPKAGDYVKADDTGVADIGTRDDNIGRFLGEYGQSFKDDSGAEVKVALIQIGVL